MEFNALRADPNHYSRFIRMFLKEHHCRDQIERSRTPPGSLPFFDELLLLLPPPSAVPKAKSSPDNERPDVLASSLTVCHGARPSDPSRLSMVNQPPDSPVYKIYKRGFNYENLATSYRSVEPAECAFVHQQGSCSAKA